jgi:hypothetical protein
MRFIKVMLAYAFLLTAVGSAAAKDKAPKDFDNKFFVVTAPGLAVGTCDLPCTADDTFCSGKLLPTLAVRIDGASVEYHPQSGFGICHGTLLPKEIPVGTVLASTLSSIDKREGRYCLLLQTSWPITVTRGIGAFAHSSEEFGALSIRIHLSDPTDASLISAALTQWLTLEDSLANAMTLSMKLKHTQAEQTVKRIKMGMTFEEVESVMGLPETRVDLGQKVLFKYPTMTITFEDGKVADVK